MKRWQAIEWLTRAALVLEGFSISAGVDAEFALTWLFDGATPEQLKIKAREIRRHARRTASIRPAYVLRGRLFVARVLESVED